ncbi:MAG TPA: hypothetical protein VKV05_11130 [Terriglobales bacterium]|nr:hypothetical protein [Terriglobales bacterium]
MLNLSEQKNMVRGALLEAEAREPLVQYARKLPDDESCLGLLRLHGAGCVSELAQKLQSPPIGDFARCILIRAARAALDGVEELRVAPSVKGLILQDFADFASPPPRWAGMFDPATVRYQEMVKIVTFQRFPAGQYHWEVSAFPRRLIMQAGPRDGFRLAQCLWNAGGRRPMWEVHVNDRRPNPVMLTPKGAYRSYYRIASSLPYQPEVKGLMECAWLYSAAVARVSPHLAWLRSTFEENGGVFAEIGPAPPESGFLVGDPKRRELYERGEFRPTLTVVIWPRTAVLDWARRHPEFDQG